MTDNPQKPTQEQINALLKQGVEAAKNKDQATARKYLAQVLRANPQSERAWFWLASVAKNDDERIKSLSQVLKINPDNQRAAKILETMRAKQEQESEILGEDPLPPTTDQAVEDDLDLSLDKKPKKAKVSGSSDDAEKSSPVTDFINKFSMDTVGETRVFKYEDQELVRYTSPSEFTIGSLDSKMSRYIGIGGAVFLVFFCCILLIGLIGGGGDDADTMVADNNNTVTQPTAISNDNNNDIQPTPTVDIGPTAFVSSTPVPTETPLPTLTPTPEPIQYPPPPNEATGKIVLASGQFTENDQPIVMFDLATDQRTLQMSGSERGSDASVSGDSQRFVYMEYSPQGRRSDAKILNVDGSNDQFLDSLFPNNDRVDGIEDPAWAPSDTSIAFVGDPRAASGGKNLYVYQFNIPEGETPFIEYESADRHSDPAWAPDASRIVYVADFSTSGGSGTDLQIFEVGTRTAIGLTSDFGQIVESDPNWGNNNNLIVYTGSLADQNGSDIYIIPADGQGSPSLVIDLGPNDINPVWSPDDRFIAFSSDVNGPMSAYIYDTLNNQYYTISEDRLLTNIVEDWIR